MLHDTFPTAITTLMKSSVHAFLKEDEAKGDLVWMHGHLGQFLLEMSREDETVREGFKDVVTAVIVFEDYIHRREYQTKTMWEKVIRTKLGWRLSRNLPWEHHEEQDVENIVSLMVDAYDVATQIQRTWFFFDWEAVSPVVREAVGCYLSTLWLLLDEAPDNGKESIHDEWMKDWTERRYYQEQATQTLLEQEGWHGLDFEASMDEALTSLTANSPLEERRHADLKEMFRPVHASAKQKQE